MRSRASRLYPELDSYACGMLEVVGGDRIYWETCGNPDGKPALVLHGGPGSGCTPWHRRLFDPSTYRVILFDQRNCGRSLPSASDPSTELAGNTTDNLIDDIESLRALLGVERLLVLGGSWGSALALAYAERYPQHVSELILFGVTTGRWPPTSGLAPRFADPSFALAFARIVTHYVRHDAWLGDGRVLSQLDVLRGIRAVLINGRFDFQAPVATAWEIHRRLPGSRLVVVDDAGHAADDSGITEAIVRATDDCARS
jgi:proline iminopeptidase